jgi:NADP-dependent 3-hydroxy acid dehydrogenase YdfG
MATISLKALNQQVIVITGASSGMGSHSARRRRRGR